MHHQDLLAIANSLGDARTFTDYLRAARAAIGQWLPGDEVFWISTDYGRCVSVVVRGPDAAVDRHLSKLVARTPNHPVVTRYRACHDLAPRRLSDVAARHANHAVRGTDTSVGEQEKAVEEAMEDVLERSLGRHQLSLVVEASVLVDHAWIVGRDGQDFSDEEMNTAGWLLPVLTAYDRAFTVPGPANPGADHLTKPLTERETDVLSLLARGLTAAAIGRRLGISSRTVSKHLEHAYAKLDEHDRMLATQRAISLGILRGGTQ